MSLKQSGIVRRLSFTGETYKSNGLMLRGVVTATYVIDNPKYPKNEVDDAVGVFCDVLCYASMPSLHWAVLPKVMVMQDKGSLHNGRIWKPKATVIDIKNTDLILDGATNPASFDGDHVLIGFIDNNLNQPIILGGVAHPYHNVGNEDKTVGHRNQLKMVDGDPDFWKHHGTFYGIADNGDFVLDSTLANDGTLTADGKEQPAPTDGKGSEKRYLPQGAVSLLSIAGGSTLQVEKKDADAKMVLGDGAKHVSIVEALQTFLDTTIKTWLINHTHPTGFGPSGVPMQSGTYPAWDPNINSTHLAIPDK